MTADLLTYGLLALVAVIAGSVAGGLTAWKLHHREPAAELATAEPEDDQWIDSEIDLASVRWAEAKNYPPEAAGLMSARLKTLHKIGTRKGWLK
jgi:hypothetical protein